MTTLFTLPFGIQSGTGFLRPFSAVSSLELRLQLGARAVHRYASPCSSKSRTFRDPACMSSIAPTERVPAA